MTVKISNLPAATSVGSGDVLPVVQSGTTKKIDLNSPWSINIDGGNIDGTPIGVSSASSGAFTTLDASDQLRLTKSASLTELRITASGVANFNVGFNNSGSTTQGIVNNAAYLNVRQAYPIVFSVGESEKMRIDSSGHAIIPAGVTLGTAAGVYNAANTLDDYEEGTWTPTLAFNGSSVGITYGSQLGKYTKIGNIVYVQMYLSLANKGSSTGHASVEGLPFTGSAVSFGAFSPIGNRGYLNTGGEPVSCYLRSTNNFLLYSNGFDGTANSSVNHTAFANNTELDINFVYCVA